MKKYKQLTEIFNSSYDYKYNGFLYNQTHEFEFDTPTGIYIVHFVQDSPGIYERMFFPKDTESFDKTNKFDAFKILSTVFRITFEESEMMNAQQVIINPNDDTKTRYNVYKKILLQFGKGYFYIIHETSNQLIIEFL